MANKDFKVKNGIDIQSPLPVTMGGTGQTSTTNTLNSLLPAQAGNNNKVLQTDGTNTTWYTIPAAYTRGATGARPGSPTAGDLFFNTDKKAFEVWTGSAWVSVAVNGAVPLAPTIGTVTVSGLTASVPFTGPADVGDSAISTYTATSNPDNITVSNATSPISVSGLSANTAYTFTVTATNSFGVSNASSASNSITTPTTPGAPTSVTAVDPVGEDDGYALVSWNAPASNGGSAITDYVVQYSSNSGSSWTTFSDGTSSSTSATVTGLTLETAYIFRVAAVNIIGTSSYSDPSASFTPTTHDPNHMFPIAHTVVTSESPSVTINIPSTYSHLRIYTTLRSTRSAATDTVYLRFNGDTGNNYSYTGITAQNTTPAGDHAQSQSMALAYRCAAASYGAIRGIGRIDIYNYKNTNMTKSFNTLGGADLGAGGGYIDSYVGSWNNTSAISSITFLPGVGPNFNSNCVIMVYGIK